MTTSRRFAPRIGLLLLCILGIPLGLALALLAPDPFAGGEPSRFLMLLRVGGGLIALLSLWRLLGWKTLRVDAEGLEVRGWFGGTTHLWRDLESADLDQPRGQPPSYWLRFRTGKLPLVARHWRPADIAALRAMIPTG